MTSTAWSQLLRLRSTRWHLGRTTKRPRPCLGRLVGGACLSMSRHKWGDMAGLTHHRSSEFSSQTTTVASGLTCTYSESGSGPCNQSWGQAARHARHADPCKRLAPWSQHDGASLQRTVLRLGPSQALASFGTPAPTDATAGFGTAVIGPPTSFVGAVDPSEKQTSKGGSHSAELERRDCRGGTRTQFRMASAG